MAYHIAIRDENLENVAQIMSDRSGFQVKPEDVRREVDTVTTSIFSAVVHDQRKNLLSPTTAIICTVRKWSR